MKITFLPYLSELLGTFLLLLAILMSDMNPLVVGGTITLILFLSGRMTMHVNPAVTVAYFLYDKIDSFKALGYIASQIAGAIISLYVFRTFN